jgi:hypothetical protein
MGFGRDLKEFREPERSWSENSRGEGPFVGQRKDFMARAACPISGTWAGAGKDFKTHSPIFPEGYSVEQHHPKCNPLPNPGSNSQCAIV